MEQNSHKQLMEEDVALCEYYILSEFTANITNKVKELIETEISKETIRLENILGCAVNITGFEIDIGLGYVKIWDAKSFNESMINK